MEGRLCDHHGRHLAFIWKRLAGQALFEAVRARVQAASRPVFEGDRVGHAGPEHTGHSHDAANLAYLPLPFEEHASVLSHSGAACKLVCRDARLLQDGERQDAVELLRRQC